AVQMFASQMEARQLTWRMEIEEDLPLIEADPERIRQVVANLLSNAVKFTPPGGHITVGAATVPEQKGQPPRFCRLWVTDTGIGIPREEQSRVWERFYRVDTPLKVETGGLGVGLSIVKSLVEAHHGRIWLDSTPGKGSTFTILLPIRRPPSPLQEASTTYPELEEATRLE
ncbi:MAG TPA: ATP-binding protein, partial [Chloroflexi bacterium]|nr:ATP-binding protein [Chloroflexota bacterium]